VVLIIRVGARRGTETSSDPEYNKSNKCSFHVSVSSYDTHFRQHQKFR
jgi:hypothetical protein